MTKVRWVRKALPGRDEGVIARIESLAERDDVKGDKAGVQWAKDMAWAAGGRGAGSRVATSHPRSAEKALQWLVTPEEGLRAHVTANAWKRRGPSPLFVVPPESPVRVQLGQRITLEVAAWLSPESVRAIFRAAQEQVRGKRPRTLSEKALLRFEFVDRARAKRAATEPTWEALLEQWKATPAGKRPKYRCKTWRQLRRSYLETEEALLSPGLKAPSRKRKRQ
jgi:hypothetical protein